MALFIAKRRKEFNEGPLLILSHDRGLQALVQLAVIAQFRVAAMAATSFKA